MMPHLTWDETKTMTHWPRQYTESDFSTFRSSLFGAVNAVLAFSTYGSFNDDPISRDILSSNSDIFPLKRDKFEWWVMILLAWELKAISDVPWVIFIKIVRFRVRIFIESVERDKTTWNFCVPLCYHWISFNKHLTWPNVIISTQQQRHFLFACYSSCVAQASAPY